MKSFSRFCLYRNEIRKRNGNLSGGILCRLEGAGRSLTDRHGIRIDVNGIDCDSGHDMVTLCNINMMSFAVFGSDGCL